jgi:hypothetical protein
VRASSSGAAARASGDSGGRAAGSTKALAPRSVAARSVSFIIINDAREEIVEEGRLFFEIALLY